MPTAYKVMKRVIQLGDRKGETVYNVSPVCYGTLTTDDVARQIAAESTASPGDVKNVLDRYAYYVVENLKKGYAIELLGFGKLFGILLNYVLSPALLVYAAILYLYFVKITLTWSLPKGGVAAISVGFIIAAFLLRGCQAFVERRMYDWFYRHASLWTLPALAMFWVATAYRVAQYGFTEPRVYLVVVGLILTATVLLFLTRRWGRYLYVACLTIGLFGVVTYIPGITAKDIERVSQKARGNYPERERTEETYIYISSDLPVDIQGYNTLVDIRNQTHPNDTLTVYDADTLVYREAYDVLLEKQLEKVGLSRTSDSIPESVYPDLLRIELDSSAIVLEQLNLRRDSLFHVNYIEGAYYLKR